jgi:type I restriction enzyme M protein
MAYPPPASTPAPPSARTFSNFSEATAFLWSIADLLRGDYKQADYGKVILPMTVLRRLDCVLDRTKTEVLKKKDELDKKGVKNLDPHLRPISGVPFYNTSKLDFPRLLGDPAQIAENLTEYIRSFSPNARDVLERFKFGDQIEKLDESNLLFQVVQQFASVDLHPEVVPNHMMGSIFEELIRRFAEQSNETAGEHFTPREVIRLMVDVLFVEDGELLGKKGILKTLYDPACGTGGMLSVAEEHLRARFPGARLEVFGQELNDESYAICRADMMIKGQEADNIARGNSFSEDGHADRKFDYMLSNPPFGVEWKKVQGVIEKEAKLGHQGRFGAGLPRINDGSLLFLQHMLSKRKPLDPHKGTGGSRLAVVFNGSPLFTGDAGSGESEIRRWIIENDWLEAILALPDQLFYNTGISTYIWVLTNRKPEARKGKIQLINGVDLSQKMRKSLGNKRNELSAEHIKTLVQTFVDFSPSEISKIFDNEDFGYRRIVVERPLRLNFAATSDRLDRLADEKAFAKLDPRAQARLREVLALLTPMGVFKSRPTFEKAMNSAFLKAQHKLDAPLKKAILAALSERDETADVCLTSDGSPEPDTELRDHESVPLKESIDAYFEREVKPHVPDAWIDPSKTKIGYEIPFTRHFYRYKPLRPLGEIEQEIRQLEEEIRGLLGEVLG